LKFYVVVVVAAAAVSINSYKYLTCEKIKKKIKFHLRNKYKHLLDSMLYPMHLSYYLLITTLKKVRKLRYTRCLPFFICLFVRLLAPSCKKPLNQPHPLAAVACSGLDSPAIYN